MTAQERAGLAEVWKTRVQEFRASGLSGPEWCARQGLKVKQLHYWKRKFQTPDADASDTTWVVMDEAGTTANRSGAAMLVTVGPATIAVPPGFDPQLLQHLVRALAPC